MNLVNYTHNTHTHRKKKTQMPSPKNQQYQQTRHLGMNNLKVSRIPNVVIDIRILPRQSSDGMSWEGQIFQQGPHFNQQLKMGESNVVHPPNPTLMSDPPRNISDLFRDYEANHDYKRPTFLRHLKKFQGKTVALWRGWASYPVTLRFFHQSSIES